MRGMMTGVANKFKSGPSPLNPGDIANLELWIDGDSGFVDLSPNTLTIGGTEDTITASALNGHSAITYDNTAYNFVTAPVTDPTELYIVMVTIGASASEQLFFSHRDSSTELIQCGLVVGSAKLTIRGSSNIIQNLTATDTHSVWGLREYSFQKTAQEVISPVDTDSGVIDYSSQTVSSTIWTMGGFNNSGFTPNATGSIAFLAVYSVTPSAQELIDLRAYLNDRYEL